MTESGKHGIDPILVTVIQRRLKAITEEMGLVMLRTARSPILSRRGISSPACTMPKAT